MRFGSFRLWKNVWIILCNSLLTHAVFEHLVQSGAKRTLSLTTFKFKMMAMILQGRIVNYLQAVFADLQVSPRIGASIPVVSVPTTIIHTYIHKTLIQTKVHRPNKLKTHKR